MTEALLTFAKFKDEETAMDIATKLSNAGIYYEIQSEDKFFDPSFVHNTVKNNYNLKIKSSDFIEGHKILENYYDSIINSIPADYYLFSFSDEELLDIISKPDEWGPLDYQLAQHILKDRGKRLDDRELEELKSKRNEELSKPTKSQHWIVLLAYALFVSSPFFSDRLRVSFFFIALMIGALLYSTKKTLPDGRQVYMYRDKDRMQGKIIIAGAVVLGIVYILLFFRR